MKKRLFIGVPIPEEVREGILRQLHKIPGRLVPKENWHFTLHFLGEIEEEKILLLHEILKDLDLDKPFKSTIHHFSAFPNNRSARIIWLGVTDGSLGFTQLEATLRAALEKAEFKLDNRSYIPHLTLSRLRKPYNISRWINKTPFKKMSFQIQEIVVYESVKSEKNGPPLYSALFRFPLR